MKWVAGRDLSFLRKAKLSYNSNQVSTCTDRTIHMAALGCQGDEEYSCVPGHSETPNVKMLLTQNEKMTQMCDYSSRITPHRLQDVKGILSCLPRVNPGAQHTVTVPNG